VSERAKEATATTNASDSNPPTSCPPPVQVDNKGRNFLHVAVQNADIESVLFLISVQANVNSRVQDSAKPTPLHLAVQAGSEIIVRNLVRRRRRVLTSASRSELSASRDERRSLKWSSRRFFRCVLFGGTYG